MSTPSPSDDLAVRRIDRILAFMSLGLLVLAIVSFFAIMIGTATGMKQDDFAAAPWPTVTAIVWIAPPVAFALLLTVLIMTFIRRSRANKGQ